VAVPLFILGLTLFKMAVPLLKMAVTGLKIGSAREKSGRELPVFNSRPCDGECVRNRRRQIVWP
jgi:hypothetical protein